ncbi:MAG: Jag N-terminal domain-containing protein [Acidimicrobiales bacterium]|nr:Jag N-terminal domain-containing protein [Acidimicrobiales bacterium]
MQWVETTGRTIDEAKDAALDQLGVDEADAEFEVLAEPRPGLFGRMRGEARVRARVRPATPRPKVDRRDRRRRGGGGERQGRSGAPPAAPDAAAAGAVRDDDSTVAGVAAARTTDERVTTVADAAPAPSDEEVAAEAGRAATDFLEELVEVFGLAGVVTVGTGEDGAVELAVDGDDLGLLIGPKGQTLAAVQELTRTVVLRHVPAARDQRLRVDVGGYRARRRDALARFTRQVVDEVRTSGVPRALEPMSAADRKVVHDTANTLEGVRTVSEGEDPRRRVVILPAGE